MSTNYSSITNDFHKRLANIEFLDSKLNVKDPEILVEISRASILLISSGFEEFVRQIATEACKRVVKNAKSLKYIPDALLQTAWNRTFEVISSNLDKKLPHLEKFHQASNFAKPKIDALFGFIHGDLNQDIFDDLIYNKYNMKAQELNSMFRVCGIKNMCIEISKSKNTKKFFGPLGDLNTQLTNTLNQFMIRRNEISHSTGYPSGNFSTISDIEFFRALTKDICLVLESKFK